MLEKQQGGWAVKSTHTHTHQSFFRRPGLCLNTLYAQPFYSDCSDNPGKISPCRRQRERFKCEKRNETGSERQTDGQASETKYLKSIEQALQEVVSSKQFIWKSWLLAVELSGHMFDLQTHVEKCVATVWWFWDRKKKNNNGGRKNWTANENVQIMCISYCVHHSAKMHRATGTLQVTSELDHFGSASISWLIIFKNCITCFCCHSKAAETNKKNLAADHQVCPEDVWC